LRPEKPGQLIPFGGSAFSLYDADEVFNADLNSSRPAIGAMSEIDSTEDQKEKKRCPSISEGFGTKRRSRGQSQLQLPHQAEDPDSISST
jgi:hypothetical protein